MEEKMKTQNMSLSEIGYETPFLSDSRRGDSQLIKLKGGKK
jgi:hypothetical protein